MLNKKIDYICIYYMYYIYHMQYIYLLRMLSLFASVFGCANFPSFCDRASTKVAYLVIILLASSFRGWVLCGRDGWEQSGSLRSFSSVNSSLTTINKRPMICTKLVACCTNRRTNPQHNLLSENNRLLNNSSCIVRLVATVRINIHFRPC